MELEYYYAPKGKVYERKDGSFQTYAVALPKGEDVNKNYILVDLKEVK